MGTHFQKRKKFYATYKGKQDFLVAVDTRLSGGKMNMIREEWDGDVIFSTCPDGYR